MFFRQLRARSAHPVVSGIPVPGLKYLSGGHVRSSSSATSNPVDTEKKRKSLMSARNELGTIRRKLERSERALDSLSRILSLIPDPIEVVASDYAILFANRASRLLHDNETLEGTFYYESVMGLEEPPVDSPVLRAIDDDRETTYTASNEDGDVYDIAITPIELSDGRMAAMCYSRAAAPVAVPEKGEDEDNRILEKIAEMTAATLDAVLTQVTDGVLLLSTDGRPVLFNRAFTEMTGFAAITADSPDELAGILLPYRKNREKLAVAMAELIRRGETQRFETEIAGRDGGTIPVEMAVSRLAADTEEDEVIVVTLRDLKEIHEIRARIIDVLIPPRTPDNPDGNKPRPATDAAPDDSETP
jgi:PAS domain S-box-containing protein